MDWNSVKTQKDLQKARRTVALDDFKRLQTCLARKTQMNEEWLETFAQNCKSIQLHQEAFCLTLFIGYENDVQH